MRFWIMQYAINRFFTKWGWNYKLSCHIYRNITYCFTISEYMVSLEKFYIIIVLIFFSLEKINYIFTSSALLLSTLYWFLNQMVLVIPFSSCCAPYVSSKSPKSPKSKTAPVSITLPDGSVARHCNANQINNLHPCLLTVCIAVRCNFRRHM